MTVGICGICGRVGREILSVAVSRGHDLAAAFDTPASPGYGKAAGSLIQRDDIGTTVGDLSPQSVARCDCIIDFSAPAATMALLEYAVDNQTALVIGTTGLSDAQKEAVERASNRIPIILSPNMAIGVNLLFKLTEIASSVLSAGFDVEIFEAHHRHKKDAPSGTAVRLLEIVRRNRKDLAEAREVSGRTGMVGERTDDEIGVFA
jgi:4-hydroxy-tetrahydrodipicolinate reductase